MVWENYYSGRINDFHNLVYQRYPEDAIDMINVILSGKTSSGAWNKLFRRSFAVKHNINFEPERLLVCEDMVFMVNFLRYLPKINYYDGAHYHHIFYENSLSHRRQNREVMQSLHRIGEILSLLNLPECCQDGVRCVLERVKIGLMLSPECSSSLAYSAYPAVNAISLENAGGGRGKLFLYYACKMKMRPVVIIMIRLFDFLKIILRYCIRCLQRYRKAITNGLH